MNNELTIYSPQGNAIVTVPVTKGSRFRYELMREHRLTLKFSLKDAVLLPLGAYVTYREGCKAVICSYQYGTYNQRTNGFDYEVTFEPPYMKWRNKLAFFVPEDGYHESSFNLTATLPTHLDVINRRLVQLGYIPEGETFYTILTGYDPDTHTGDKEEYNKLYFESRHLNYANTDILTAIGMIAEAFGIVYMPSMLYPAESGFKLLMGRPEYINSEPAKGLKSVYYAKRLSRTDSKDTRANRIYAFGSTRNLPRFYRQKCEFTVGYTDTDCNIDDPLKPLFPSIFLGTRLPFTGGGRKPLPVFVPFRFSQYITDDISELGAAWGWFYLDKITVSARKTATLPDSVLTLSLAAGNNGVLQHTLLSKNIALKGNGEPLTLELKGAFFIPDNGFTQLMAVVENSGRETVTGSVDYRCTIWKMEPVDVYLRFNTGAHAGQVIPATYNYAPIEDAYTETCVNRLHIDPQHLTPQYHPDNPYATDISYLMGSRYEITGIDYNRLPPGYKEERSTSPVYNTGVVARRLMLPEGVPYIDTVEGLHPDEVVEEVVTFDDIYPGREGHLEQVHTAARAVTATRASGETESNVFMAYRYSDSGLTFNDGYRTSEPLEVYFKTGKMAGLTFEVNFYDKGDPNGDPSRQIWEIVRNENYGRPLPDEWIYPEDGDTYVLTGFDSMAIDLMDYVKEAENRLLAAAREYAASLMRNASTYTFESWAFDPANPIATDLLRPGDLVKLSSPAMFAGEKLLRVIGIEEEAGREWTGRTYTLGSSTGYSRIGALESKVKDLEKQK